MTKAVLRRLSVLGLAVFCVVFIASCSNTKKEDGAYKHSKALQPLEVPPDLIKPSEDASTAIPELPPPSAEKSPANVTPSTAPPAATSGTNAMASPKNAAVTLHIEKKDTQRWLVVPAPKDQVWQKVKAFLIEQGFTLAKEDEKAGTLETNWRGSEPPQGKDDLDAIMKSLLQDKYKLRIEPGSVAGASEVRVSQLGLQRVVTGGKTEWQPRVSDPMLEADLLDQLLVFLQAEGNESAAAEKLPAVQSKISTDTTTSVSTLTLNEDFDRAWRRIGLALGRGGFVIEDRNRSKGIYLIRMGTAFKDEAKSGLVSRLLGSNAGDPNARYRIHVDDRGDDSAVIVEHPGGAPVHTGIGERILSRLKEKMG